MEVTFESIINYCNMQNITEEYSRRVDKALDALERCRYILIGGGAGLSTAAGLDYSSDRFRENFLPYIRRYGMEDLYTSTFYSFDSEEEKWAYWARHISLNRYETPAAPLYKKLLELVGNHNYFVITTNVDGQFEKSGFDKDRIFEAQGDYAYFQCKYACHNHIYYNKEAVRRMLDNTEDCHIPPALVPVCPVCGGEMDVHINKDFNFVYDDGWRRSVNNYKTYLDGIGDHPVVFLELGVGYNTPEIIRFPFDKMAAQYRQATLIRINRYFPGATPYNRKATISFSENISTVLNGLNF